MKRISRRVDFSRCLGRVVSRTVGCAAVKCKYYTRVRQTLFTAHIQIPRRPEMLKGFRRVLHLFSPNIVIPSLIWLYSIFAAFLVIKIHMLREGRLFKLLRFAYEKRNIFMISMCPVLYIVLFYCSKRREYASIPLFEVITASVDKSLETSVLRLYPRISGSANPRLNFVIASHGQIAPFPAGTTPFFLEIESAPGSFVQEIPRSLNAQLTISTRPLCRSAIPCDYRSYCPESIIIIVVL